MTFKADFTYYPEGANAPIRIEFNNVSTVGVPVDDDYTDIVSDTFEPITLTITYSDYTVARHEKYEWDFGSNQYSNDFQPTKLYETAGTNIVSLSVYSEIFFDITTATFFRFKNTVTKEVVIDSMVYMWLYQHMIQPQKEALDNNQGFKDLFSASSKMFDRMYLQIKDISNVTDIKTLAPAFLKFLSETLNHKDFYAEKVGYAVQDDNSSKQLFLDYSIFSKIDAGTASDEEINVFRQFLIDTAAMFKQNGSKEAMEKFFKLYNFVVNVNELWTQNFSETTVGTLTDNFLNDATLKYTKNKLKFQGVSVAGWDNEKSQYINNFNNLLIDNYHYLSRHSILTDAVIDPLNCSATLEVNDYFPNLEYIVRDDGRSLYDLELCNGITTPCATAAIADEVRGNCPINGPSVLYAYENTSWSGVDRLIEGIDYKFWVAPTNYVKSIINILGVIPTGDTEIAEIGDDTSFDNDDYLWASWQNGVTVPPGYPSLPTDALRKIRLLTVLPNANYASTSENNNLIPNVNVSTTNDFFIVARGFLEIPQNGYYVFTLDNGNTFGLGTTDADRHISLFSLKHKTTYTQDDISHFTTLDNITFIRDNSDHIDTITASGGSIDLYSKEGEFGIIEIRQNESKESSGYYYLSPGYYAIEIKSTYSSLPSKSLKLYWEAYTPKELGGIPYLEPVIANQIIPLFNFTTLKSSFEINNISESKGKGILTIPNSLLEGGDIFKISYSASNSDDLNISGIISSENKFKDMETYVKFSPISIPDSQEQNETYPQKELMVIFRAISRKKDLYSTFDTYYAIIFNGNTSEISVNQICYLRDSDSIYFRKLNLELDPTAEHVYFKEIINPNTGYKYEINDDEYYDLKVVVKENKVSVYFRYNDEFTTAVNNIKCAVPQLVSNYKSLSNYITVVENINLLQDDKDTENYNSDNTPVIISDVYNPIDEAGSYGLAIRSSIFKIAEYKVTPYDKDVTLYETEEKWKQIKPKYLDSRNTQQLKLNSKDSDQKNNLEVNYIMTENYDGSTNVYTLPDSLQSVTDNNINKLVANNIDVTSLGTRFNIVFTPEFITRFKTVDDILNNICVPFGNFYEPFINWSKVENTSGAYIYGDPANYCRFINETANVLPHTIVIDKNDNRQYISTLTRSTSAGNILNLENLELKTLLNATSHSSYIGLWEEVCPQSAVATWTISGSNRSVQTMDNPVFEPIYINRGDTTSNIIGVRVMDENVLTDLICRYCENEIIWGLYEVSIDSTVDKLLPETTKYMSPFNYFIPIGKLQKDIVYYLPPAQMLNSCYSRIKLLGVYANHSFEGFTTLSKTSFRIDIYNTFEQRYKSRTKCNYFLNLQTSFVDKLTKYNARAEYDNLLNNCPENKLLETDKDDTNCNLPNSFIMPDRIISVLSYIDSCSGCDVTTENDYTWWNPSVLYIKRKFSIAYPDNTDDNIFSGLNANGWFYSGTYLMSGGNYGTPLTFEDGNADYLNSDGITGNKHILDASWCMTSTAWDYEFAITDFNEDNISSFVRATYFNMGFDPDVTKNVNKFVMGTEKLITIGNYLNAPMVIDTISVSGTNQVLFGAKINGDGGKYGRTISPVGLYNWFETHASTQEMSGTADKISWSITDLNNQFRDCFKFNAVYGEINGSSFSINKYWSFLPENVPVINDIVKVQLIDDSCSPNGIILGLSNGFNGFYSIPTLFENYLQWDDKVNKVIIDNETIKSDHYYARKNTATNKTEIVLNNQTFDFSKYLGDTEFILQISSDKLFNLTDKTTLSDNFFNTREINWIPFVTETGDYYITAPRTIDTELKYTTTSAPYNVVDYKNNKALQYVNKFSATTVGQFSGEVTGTKEVGVGKNNGSPDLIMISDVQSSNFSLSCEVIFDNDIINTAYDKNFELILKGESKFININKENGLTSFYYVGIGTKNFDVALGMRSYDTAGQLVKDTFLASFGKFNVRSIKENVWYTIRAAVSTTTIMIYFNEHGQDEQLIINYTIDKKYEKLSDRYLKGEFETLQSVIIGLQELSVTYPIKLEDNTSAQYTFDNFKEEFAATLPINGVYNGFRVVNPMTYVTNVKYIVYSPKSYTMGSTYDSSDFNDIITKIKNRYDISKAAVIKKVQQSLDFITFVQIDDILYYQNQNNDPEKYSNPIETFYVVEDKIITVEKDTPSDSAIGLNDWEPGDHTFTWCLNSNTLNIVKLGDFYASVPNISGALLVRDGTTYTSTETVLVLGDEITLSIGGSRNVIWPLEGELGIYNLFVRAFQEGFTREYPILIKDKTIYKDGIRSYLDYTNKKIREVVINDNMMNIIFEDL